MQFSPSIPHSWRELVPYAVAIFLGYLFSGSLILALVAVISLWLNRKNPEAAFHLSEAQTELALAQAEDARTSKRKTDGEIFDEMHERLGLLVDELGRAEGRIRILELEVARARAAGFLERDEKGGTGPNPAA